MRAAVAASLIICACVTSVRAEDGPDAKTELSAAINLFKTSHINSDRLDWPTVSAAAFQMLGDGTKPADAYPAIRSIISQLGEKHTFLVPSDQWKAIATGQPAGNAQPPYWQPPEGHFLESGIGLLQVRAYLGSAQDDIAYAAAARQTLMRFAEAHVCRVIVDLRGNAGGNMYPMINGVTALLGAPPYGYWDGARSNPHPAWAIAGPDPAAPKFATLPVALLVDHGTVSSGEFTAIAFEGRARTRIFGQETGGYVTANTPMALPDGARIAMTDSWSTDRLHRPYRSAIAPDETTLPGQQTLDAAIAWLKKQPCGKARRSEIR